MDLDPFSGRLQCGKRGIGKCAGRKKKATVTCSRAPGSCRSWHASITYNPLFQKAFFLFNPIGQQRALRRGFV